MCTLLTNPQLMRNQDALYNGWHDNGGVLLPNKNLNPLPDNVITLCSCKTNCITNRCKCVANEIKCVVFCHGKERNVCTNDSC